MSDPSQGNPFQLQTTFSGGIGGFGRPRPNLFGDEFQLRLDPDVERELTLIRLRMEIKRIETAWANPNWLDMHRILLTLPTGPLVSPRPAWSRFTPPAPRPPIVPRGDGPEEMREASISDLLGALWKVPVIQQAATRVTDQVTNDLWRQRTTGERVLIVSWATIIGGGTIAGILGNRESRVWALDRINGQDISIPGVDGFSFRLHAKNGALTGGGATIPLPRGFSISGGMQPRDVPAFGDNPATTFPEYTFTIRADLLKAIPSLRGRF